MNTNQITPHTQPHQQDEWATSGCVQSTKTKWYHARAFGTKQPSQNATKRKWFGCAITTKLRWHLGKIERGSVEMIRSTQFHVCQFPLFHFHLNCHMIYGHLRQYENRALIRGWDRPQSSDWKLLIPIGNCFRHKLSVIIFLFHLEQIIWGKTRSLSLSRSTRAIIWVRIRSRWERKSESFRCI